MDSRNTKRSLHLLEDIIEEILSRLSVKSLLRFRCVSKSWRSLIAREQFIKTHLQNSTENTSLTHHRVILTYGFSLPHLTDDPTAYNEAMAGYVVGCCNGVVCILKQEVFFLWNPATRNSTKLPKLDLQIPPISKCGFGWDAASGAYKVFVVSSGGLGQIYSSKTKSWRRVCMHGRRLPVKHKNAQFVCGKIHWPTHRHTESFDLSTEVFGEIEHPFDLEFGMQLWLGEIKGCLSLVCDDSDGTTLGVWIMKEYGVKESWLKVLNASLACPQQHDGPFSAMLEIVSEGVVLLIYGSAFLVCSRDDVAVLISSPDKVSTCCKVSSRYTTHFYVESLVSPVPDANR